jgi:signal transduction histidine kinase
MLNAFQAMPDGGILTISFWHAGAVFIEIGDTGHGIAQANLSKIFDPFFSMRNDSRRPGLGLSVCQSIISEHGGTVTVRTSARDGTAFTVRLPDIAAPASVAS